MSHVNSPGPGEVAGCYSARRSLAADAVRDLLAGPPRFDQPHSNAPAGENEDFYVVGVIRYLRLVRYGLAPRLMPRRRFTRIAGSFQVLFSYHLSKSAVSWLS